MPEPVEYARRIARGSALVFTFSVIAALMGLLLRFFLARTLSVEEYGLFFGIVAFISLFVMFRSMGLGTTLARHIPGFRLRKQFATINSSIVTALVLQSASSLAIGGAIFVLADHIALEIFGTLSASLPLRIMSAWLFVEGIFMLLRSVFQGFQDMKLFSPILFFERLLVVLAAAVLVGVLGFGAEGAALAYLIGAALTSFIAFGLLASNYPHVIRKKVRITKPLTKKLLLFGIPLFAAGFGSMILGYMDTVIITIFRTLDEVAFYQVARPLAGALRFFPMALGAVFLPVVSELWERDERKLLGNSLHFLTKFSFILIIPPALIFIAFPEIVIRMLFREGFLPASAALQILGVASILSVVYVILSTTIIGVGKPVIIPKIIGAMAGLNLVGNLLLVPIFGIEGAAVATLASNLLGLLLGIYFVRKIVKFTVPTTGLLKTVIGAELTLIMILILKSVVTFHPWITAAIVLIPSFCLYAVWLLASGAITKKDLSTIKRIVPLPEPIFGLLNKLARE